MKTEKMTAKEFREKFTNDKILNKKSESTKSLIKKAVTICHEYIRKRDSNEFNYVAFRCISCDEIKPSGDRNLQAGHYFEAGIFKALKFTEENIHGQCLQCNFYRSAVVKPQYRLNLIEKIGQKKFDEMELQSKMTRRSIIKYEAFELKKIIGYYKLKIEALK